MHFLSDESKLYVPSQGLHISITISVKKQNHLDFTFKLIFVCHYVFCLLSIVFCPY